MAVSPSPFLSPPGINFASASAATAATPTTTKLLPGSCPTLPLLAAAFKPTCRQSVIILCSCKSEGGLTSGDKKVLIERYGFNPNQILSDNFPKSRRRKNVERERTGRGKPVPEEENKPERETHRLLQVLGGTAKRKKLLSPKGMDVRPMMEVVKGSAFDILQSAGGCPASLRPGRWLDLYSGTGSVGIEAISRGCSEAHFVEMDPWVVSNVLQPNLECTGFLGASVIHTICVENFLEQAEQFLGDKKVFDFISITPPYAEVDYAILMDQISKSAIAGEDTFIVVEYPLRTNMLDSCGCLGKITARRFGRTHLVIYGPKWAQKKRRSAKVTSKGGV